MADSYPYLRFTGAANNSYQEKVNPVLLDKLNQIGQQTGHIIDIISGRRPTNNQYGYQNDPHQRGEAVDAYIGGKPIGDVIPLQLFTGMGLEGGNTPGFWNSPKNNDPTGADAEHVQIPGSGVNKSMVYNPGSSTNAQLMSAQSPPSGVPAGLASALGFDPAQPDASSSSQVPGDLYGNALVSTIYTMAQRYGIDPRIALAVVPHEGGFVGDVGDNNTSFGPFQLHAGGALPADVWAKGEAYAKQWANSPEGIAYALQTAKNAMAKYGDPSVTNWVQHFEIPAAQYQAGEIAKAQGTYNQLQGVDPAVFVNQMQGTPQPPPATNPALQFTPIKPTNVPTPPLDLSNLGPSAQFLTALKSFIPATAAPK